MKTVRQTKQRQAVLEAVRGTRTHPDASWVYDEVRKVLPRVSLGTIYRALDALVADGELIKIQGAGEAARYDLRHPNHHHLICRDCGRIVDLDLDVPEFGSLHSQIPPGFDLQDVTLTLHGCCRECQVPTHQS